MSKKHRGPDRAWVDNLSPEEQTRLMRDAVEGPGYTGLPDAIGYSDRTPDEFVVSGPMGDNTLGAGRWFPDLSSALAWAQGKYERARLVHDREDAARWAILVKPRG